MSDPSSELCIDADVLMNLLATGHLDAILKAHGVTGLVCPRTEAEALYLNPRAAGGFREMIDLEAFVADGALRRVNLEDPEVSTFVRLAAKVDDGEAQVLAVALHRSLGVATDDRKARRLAGDLGISVHSTPELLKVWAAGVSASEASAAVVDIEVRASYRPRRSDPLRDHWESVKSGKPSG